MSVLNQQTRIGDLLLWETHPGFCRVSATVKNNDGAVDAAILAPVGYPVKSDGAGGYQLAVSGDEAVVIGLILQQNELDVTHGTYSAKAVAILVRGPALIDNVTIPTLDFKGGSFTLATIQTALNSLGAGIRTLAEPTISATQGAG